MKHRLLALDWLRGLVVLIMVTDHGSSAYNRDRLIIDSTFFYVPGQDIPALAFLYRWVSHLCAPTFVFLAGVALALSVERRRARGVTQARIDRDLVIRGVIILALELGFVGLFWGDMGQGQAFLQVLYAIGLSMIFMVPLRRLPTLGLLALAVLVLVGAEALLGLGMGSVSPDGVLGTIVLYLLSGGFAEHAKVIYPVIPWLSIMALGWVFGVYLARRYATDPSPDPSPDPKSGSNAGPSGSRSPVRLLLVLGVLSLAVFVVLRAINGYGNMGLYRPGGSVTDWLLVSKYPPSMSFVTLELGIMALILALCFVIQDRVGADHSRRNPLLVFGQTALFFYLGHIALLELSARALSMYEAADLGTAIAAAIVVTLILYPACLWYRGYKASHPSSWVRYI